MGTLKIWVLETSRIQSFVAPLPEGGHHTDAAAGVSSESGGRCLARGGPCRALCWAALQGLVYGLRGVGPEQRTVLC